MTSKFPDPIDRDSDLAESRPHGGDSARSDAPSAKLTQLREAITEIDQRHAEGEPEYFADTASSSESPMGVGAAPSEDVPSFADALSFDDDDEPLDFDASYAKAKKTAMNMLAMRDHASGELRDKLLKRDFLPEAVDELIAKLQKSRLLNDEEFAHRYVRAHRERRKLSRTALKRELNKKGLPAEIVSDAVEDVDGEDDLARQVAEKKAASTRGLDYEVRERRILGMLARRGFASSICIKVTREVLAED
ncbi:regulatory protein RecX [Brevibacterium sp. FME17]|uniref:regulatory protein RecX n=1 Tax=Brevibacterium sp. FME17 TaxID=2742606 RepID=UPI0018691878|nr:regulatory protein RecX [Brevibacterium sp. FME17]